MFWTNRRHVCATTMLAVAAITAQAQMACHDMGKKETVQPPDKLPMPQKMTGIGNSQMKITATREAQAWFNQGLTLQHDFWDYEAAKAFEQAVRVDPSCAMCYWGLAEALRDGHGTKGSYADIALDKAVELSHKASKKEQLIIQATVADEQPPMTLGARGKRAPQAKELWQKALDKDKNDTQVKIFLAESWMDGYDDKGEPRDGTKKGIAILEEVMRDHPDDSAVNHYWIHAMEPSSHPERAIESAKRLASQAPSSGHMVHMPGHIFYRTGDYAEAEHWFTASTEVDEAYMRANHVGVDDDWNYVHNLMYSIDNLMSEGKLTEATELSGKLTGARGRLAATLYTFAPRDSMTRVNTLLPIALRTGDWKQVQALLAESKPDTKLENLLFLAGELKDFAHGMQAVEDSDLVEAQHASDALDAALYRQGRDAEAKAKAKADKEGDAKKEEPKKDDPNTMDVMPDAMEGPLVQVLSIMSLELRGSILIAQKKLPEAKELFKEAAKQEKDLGYREPPMYIRPVGETEGAALLRAGDAKGAHEAYAAVNAERPNLGFALYGMAKSSEAEGNAAQAHKEYAQFLTAWSHSDPNAELDHAKAYQAGTTKPSSSASGAM